MTVKIKQDFIPINPKHRDGLKRTPKHITIHNNGNPRSNAKEERSWLGNPSNNSTYGFHYVHDDKETIQCIPDDERAYHAGDGGNGEGNMYSISHEICELWSNGSFISKGYYEAEKRTAKVVAEQIKQYGWVNDWDEVLADGSMKRLKTHKDFSGKNCPRITLTRWKEFKQLIRDELDVVEEVKEKTLSDYTFKELLQEIHNRL